MGSCEDVRQKTAEEMRERVFWNYFKERNVNVWSRGKKGEETKTVGVEQEKKAYKDNRKECL